MEWIDMLYAETNELWKENGSDKKGYSIFYSPPVFNPDIMIVGYNPGGGENSFDESNASIVPKEHDYFPPNGNYPLARNMRKIFEFAGMTEKLRGSVKFNLIFFRSRNKKEITKNKNLIDFCKNETNKIIINLKPKLILAEGIDTYKELLGITKGYNEKDQVFTDKNDKTIHISSTGKTEGGAIKIIGIIHPSGGYGISDDMLTEIGKNIKAELNN